MLLVETVTHLSYVHCMVEVVVRVVGVVCIAYEGEKCLQSSFFTLYHHP